MKPFLIRFLSNRENPTLNIDLHYNEDTDQNDILCPSSINDTTSLLLLTKTKIRSESPDNNLLYNNFELFNYLLSETYTCVRSESPDIMTE